MPRIARKQSQSCFYHVMVQGIDRSYIFKKSTEVEKFKEIILEKMHQCNVTILAYCIMGNHAHLLIYAEKTDDLSKYMHKVNTAYSFFYNKENERVGYVFRDRYCSQDILDIRQLYNCLRYIHNNPVKAKMCANMEDYTYSSYKEFIGEKYIITDKSIELLFGNTKNYKEQFVLIHSKYKEEDFIDIKEDISTFVANTEKKYGRKISEIKDEKDILKEVIKEARKQTDITIDKLAKILNLSKSTIERMNRKGRFQNRQTYFKIAIEWCFK